MSDPLFLTSLPLTTLVRERETKLRRTLAQIEALAGKYGVTAIVLGLPRNMDGTEGERCEKTRAFGDQLARRLGLPVHYVDERLTTAEAAEILTDTGVPKQRQKEHIDAVAASLILEDYMHSEEYTKKQQEIRSEEEWVTVADPETGRQDRLCVVEKTTVGGRTYLLLAEDNSDECEAWIFFTEHWDEEEPDFSPVEDEEEYEAVAKIFEQLLEDTELLR